MRPRVCSKHAAAPRLARRAFIALVLLPGVAAAHGAAAQSAPGRWQPPPDTAPCPGLAGPNAVFGCYAPSDASMALTLLGEGRAFDPSAVVEHDTGLPLVAIEIGWCSTDMEARGACNDQHAIGIAFDYGPIGLHINRNAGGPLFVSAGETSGLLPFTTNRITRDTAIETDQIGTNPPVTTVIHSPWSTNWNLVGRDMNAGVSSNEPKRVVQQLADDLKALSGYIPETKTEPGEHAF